MMQLSRAQKAGVNAAGAFRETMRRTGKTLAGQWLWTDEEVATLRALYPDYRVLVAALARRTRKAIELKAAKLGVSRKLRVWSGGEVVKFRGPYIAGTPVSAIAADLKRKTPSQVYAKAAKKRYRRPRRRPKPVQWPLVDSVRQRAFEMRISLRELDEETGGGRYFASPRRLDMRRVNLALPILGGAFALRWRT